MKLKIQTKEGSLCLLFSCPVAPGQRGNRVRLGSKRGVFDLELKIQTKEGSLCLLFNRVRLGSEQQGNGATELG